MGKLAPNIDNNVLARRAPTLVVGLFDASRDDQWSGQIFVHSTGSWENWLQTMYLHEEHPL